MKILFLVIIPILLLAAPYKHLTFGYLLQDVEINHPKIDQKIDEKHYGYEFKYLNVHKNYLSKIKLTLQPKQNLAKGWSDGSRFDSTFYNYSLAAGVGLKKYLFRKIYISPIIYAKYYYSQIYYNFKRNLNKKENESGLAVPLQFYIGYNLKPKSDLMFGMIVDEDITGLSKIDHDKIELKINHTLVKSDIALQIAARKSRTIHTNQIKEVKDELLFSIGFAY